MTLKSRMLVVLWALMSVCCGSLWTCGQGILIDDSGDHFHLPRPWPHSRPRPEPTRTYHLRELSIDTAIRSQVATTQVTQVFQNTGSVQIEASFIFPLPYDGAVERMTFLVDGKEYEAKLLSRDEARRIYEGYVRRNQDPALLEWVGVGMFKTSVFPIPPGASRTVSIRYSQLLKRDGNLVDYIFPLSTARFTSKPIDKLTLRVAIASEEEIKSIYSPTHDIQVQRDDPRNAVVTMSAGQVVPTMDFRLMFNSLPGKVSASLISHWPAGEDQGYFLLLASPQFEATESSASKRTVIFVVDQSGSMSGPKIEQARQAAKFVINNLRSDDLFNIIPYESRVETMAPELLRFNDESRQQAIGYINGIQAGGGTNIRDALQTALNQISDGSSPSFIVFLTDGLPTVGETNELRIAEACRTANKHRTRIISFGVGYDVNSRLLDRITRENHGVSEYVRPNEDVEASVARLFSKMSAPVLTDIKLDFKFDQARVESGPPVNRIYPQGLSDLFAGSQLAIVGRYRQSGPARLDLSGMVGDKAESFQFDFQFAARGTSSSYGFLAQLWAIRRIGEIIDLIDLHGRNDELINELVGLATKYGIVTQYTSFLADENAAPAQLTDYRNNALFAGELLGRLEQEASGSFGFESRGEKQQMKIADNLAQISGRSFDSAGDMSAGFGGRGGFGGGGGFGAGGGRVANPLMGSSEGIRKIGNATLYKRGKMVVADNAVELDLEKDADKIVVLTRYSDEYFALLSNSSSEENLILAQQQPDEELILKVQGNYYRVR